MTQAPDRDALRELICEIVLAVAPDLSREDLVPEADFRYDLGLDSIDALNIATGIAERTGLEIPEVDRARLQTFETLLDYVATRLAVAD